MTFDRSPAGAGAANLPITCARRGGPAELPSFRAILPWGHSMRIRWIGFLVVSSVVATSAQALTVDDLLARNLAARGLGELFGAGAPFLTIVVSHRASLQDLLVSASHRDRDADVSPFAPPVRER